MVIKLHSAGINVDLDVLLSPSGAIYQKGYYEQRKKNEMLAFYNGHLRAFRFGAKNVEVARAFEMHFYKIVQCLDDENSTIVTLLAYKRPIRKTTLQGEFAFDVSYNLTLNSFNDHRSGGCSSE